MDLTETEEIKKRCQEYTEELYQKKTKKNHNGLDNHNSVVTHLEHDTPRLHTHALECEVKWVLGSITMNKASGGDGIAAELFQILT